jgi:hypothetical protein
MSFAPISVLDSRIDSSKYSIYSCGLKRSSALILNQNPIPKIPSVNQVIQLNNNNLNTLNLWSIQKEAKNEW